MNFHIFKNKKMPWGDYGDILLTGYAYMDEGILYVERAGNFVPLVYSCFSLLLITDKMKQLLESSGLTGFSFTKAVIKKAVNIDWLSWDLTAMEPKVYPRGGEPENYIECYKHNSELAESMPDIWGMILNDDETLVGRMRENVGSLDELYLIENSWTGYDIFLSKGAGYIFFTEKAKQWFEKHSDGYAIFEEFNSRVGTEDEVAKAIEYITPKVRKPDPYAHLTTQDWKDFQKFQRQAYQFMEKQKSSKTEKSKVLNRQKAIDAFKQAEHIRPLPKKEKQILDNLISDGQAKRRS